MTDRRDEGYAIRPVRLGEPGTGGGPRRGRRLGALIVLIAALGVVLIGWVGPRLGSTPSFDISYFATPTPDPDATPGPTPTPTPEPSSRFDFATPLPAVTRNGPDVLQGRIGVWTDQFHSVDLETGTMSGGVVGSFGTDAFLPAADGDGWTCICMVDQVDSARMQRTVDLVRLGADGSEQSRIHVVTLSGDQVQDRSYGVQTDVAVAADDRTALVVVGTRDGSAWDYSVFSFDLATGSVGGTWKLGREQAPAVDPSALPSTASDGTPIQVVTDVYGPQIRRSPDGRHVLAWTTLQQYTQDALIKSEVFGWTAELDERGNVVGTAPAPGIATLPPYCGGMGFIDDATFAAVCPISTDSSPTEWKLQELDPGGRPLDTIALPGTSNWYTEPLFDTANRIIWLWDPQGLVLHRIELDSNRVSSQHFDLLVERADGTAPAPGRQPAFARANSSLYEDVSWDMAGAPDGSRLYLVGYDAAKSNANTGNQVSAGILVVDPATLALLDRWQPDAQYFSVQPIQDGSIVVAGGAPAVDAAGNSVPWQASLTFHDASDGRILLRLGQIGDGSYPQIIHR